MLEKRLSKQKGFTLIEMVVVIAVMGVLMGLAFRGFAGIQESTRDTRRIADLRRVQTALELYFARCGHYPTTLTCGAPQGTTQGALGWSELITQLRLVASEEEIPSQFPQANIPQYRFGPRGHSYVIGVTMERRGNNVEVIGTNILGLDCGTLANPGTTFCLRN